MAEQGREGHGDQDTEKGRKEEAWGLQSEGGPRRAVWHEANLSVWAGAQRSCTAWLWLTPAALDWPASSRSRTSPF